MGFFSDLKEDLSQAVNELLPDDTMEEPAVEPELSQEEPAMAFSDGMSLDDVNLSDMLDKMEAMNLEMEPAESAESVEEPVMEEIPQEEPVIEEPVMEEAPEEKPAAEEIPEEEPVMEEAPAEEPVVEEIPEEEPVMEEAPAEEPAAEEIPEEEPVMEEAPAEEPAAEEIPEEEPVMEEAPVEEPVAEEIPEEAPMMEEAAIESVPEEMSEEMIEEETAETVTAEENKEEVEEKTMADNKELEMEEKEKRVASDETALITVGMTIRGDIETAGSLDLTGRVIGNVDVLGKLNITGTVEGNSKASEIYAEKAHIVGEVRSDGALKIGQNSVIIGNVYGNAAVVAGAIKGDIDVKGPVVLDSTAIVMGNIKSKSVQINNGAVIEGMCSQCYADVTPTSFFDEFKLD